MESQAESTGGEQLARIPFADALKVWAKIGFLSFGGPAGQVALMHKELVEERKWIDEERFLHALNYCMLLPGPEAQQLAAYIGWLMHKTRGGLAAGLLFVLPGFLAILLLSIVYASYRTVPLVAALFFGLKAAVLAVVVEAVLRIGKRALKSRALYLIACAAFVAIFLFQVAFPVVVVAAFALGIGASRVWPDAFPFGEKEAKKGKHATVIDRMALAGELTHTRPSTRRAVVVLLTFGLLWGLPLVVLSATFGNNSVFVLEGVFFSKAAVVTFGGAYAVLAYIAQRAVETYGWLGPGEMLDGLGLAETTPGPLIMVVQFVGFLGAFRNPGDLMPLLAGILGSVVTVWVTFVPCFLWIFLGAPYIEALRGRRALHAGLSSITAAVVGVILNLSVWFGLHVMFRTVNEVAWGPLRLSLPVFSTVDWASVVLSGVAMFSMFRLKLGLPKTLLGSCLLGLGWKLVGGALS
jgi:chromate transporter